jgi:hypothetical protein
MLAALRAAGGSVHPYWRIEMAWCTVSHTGRHEGSLSRAHRERAGRSEQVASFGRSPHHGRLGRNYIDVTPLTGVIDTDDLLGEVDVIGR